MQRLLSIRKGMHSYQLFRGQSQLPQQLTALLAVRHLTEVQRR